MEERDFGHIYLTHEAVCAKLTYLRPFRLQVSSTTGHFDYCWSFRLLLVISTTAGHFDYRSPRLLLVFDWLFSVVQ